LAADAKDQPADQSDIDNMIEEEKVPEDNRNYLNYYSDELIGW